MICCNFTGTAYLGHEVDFGLNNRYASRGWCFRCSSLAIQTSKLLNCLRAMPFTLKQCRYPHSCIMCCRCLFHVVSEGMCVQVRLSTLTERSKSLPKAEWTHAFDPRLERLINFPFDLCVFPLVQRRVFSSCKLLLH